MQMVLPTSSGVESVKIESTSCINQCYAVAGQTIEVPDELVAVASAAGMIAVSDKKAGKVVDVPVDLVIPKKTEK